MVIRISRKAGEPYDAFRTEELQRKGIRVIRFENRELVADPVTVSRQILEVLREIDESH